MQPNTVITSASNATIKHIRKLVTSSKTRRDTNEYIAEGIHLVRSFLESGKTPRSYLCAQSALANHEITELLQQLEKSSAQCIVVTDSLFESFASVDAMVGIAIIFTLDTPAHTDAPLAHNTVILEAVQDPGNLGTILRTVAAVGTQNVIISPDCASPWSPKALRAGMGAQFGLNIHESSNLEEIVRTATIPAIVTTLSPASKSLYELTLSQPVVWIFGNEGQGVSEDLANLATQHVSIPQADTPVESLNVAAAAAVCLYEQYRQTTQKGVF